MNVRRRINRFYRKYVSLGYNSLGETLETKDIDLGILDPAAWVAADYEKHPDDYYIGIEGRRQKYVNKVEYPDARFRDYKDYLLDYDLYIKLAKNEIKRYLNNCFLVVYYIDYGICYVILEVKYQLSKLPISKKDITTKHVHYHPFQIIGQSLIPFFTVFFFSISFFLGIALLKWDTCCFEQMVFKYKGLSNTFPIDYIINVSTTYDFFSMVYNGIFSNKYASQIFFNTPYIWEDPIIKYIFNLLLDPVFYTKLEGDFFSDLRREIMVNNMIIFYDKNKLSIDKRKSGLLPFFITLNNIMFDLYFDFRLSPTTPVHLLAFEKFIFLRGYTNNPWKQWQLYFYSINKFLFSYVYNKFAFETKREIFFIFYIIGYFFNFFLPILYLFIKVRLFTYYIFCILEGADTLYVVKILFLMALAGFISVVGYWIYQVACIESISRTIEVDLNIKLSFCLFIVSEIMLFFSLFWAFFHSALNPSIFTVTWPPIGTPILSVYGIPLANTILLITSGITLTIAHLNFLNLRADRLQRHFPYKPLELPYTLKPIDMTGINPWLMEVQPCERKPFVGEEPNYNNKFFFYIILTLSLGSCFLVFQGIEYATIPLSINDGIFGSLFFFLTGFHGFHVFVGICFLFFVAAYYIDLCYDIPHESRNRYLFFDFAVWYWHFVDVVWLILYAFIYFWSFVTFSF
jgi:cytochrome c oxidase subunit 3